MHVNQELLTSNAYKIFLSEFERHLAKSREVFADISLIEPDDIYRCAGAFHTIKGGAGFFGLKQIADIAGQLEKILCNPELNLENDFEFVQELIFNLQKLGVELPPPAQI